ncbi:MAG: MinD/ParA family protein [Peptococcaceae bacterium]|nr:MinD/ParA family protein [Peptococcaceae bacterium]
MQDQASQLRALIAREEKTLGGTTKGTRVIAVSSGKGGVGKTNISINLAVSLASSGSKVVVVDGDLGLANVDVMCGLMPVYNLEDVIRGNGTLTEALLDGPNGIKILPGGTGAGLVDMGASDLENLFYSLKPLEEMADILILDTGAGIARSVIGLLNAADEVVVVVTPEPTSITDAYSLVKTLLTTDKQRRVSLLVNRVHSKEDAENTYVRLSGVIDRFLQYKVDYLGFIFEDPALVKAVMRQTPVTIAFPTAPASRCFATVADKLVGTIRQVPSQSKGLRGLMEGLVAHVIRGR